MGGPRLRHISGSTEDNATNINSSSDNHMESFRRIASRRFLHYPLIASLIGANMAQPRQAAAQDRPQMDVSAAQTLWTNVGTKLTAVRDTLAQMRSGGMPAQVTFSDRNMSELLELLGTNATALGIPITGTTREERFRSLNNWLNAGWNGRTALSGRTQDSPIDQAAFDELTFRLRLASASVQGDLVAQQASGGAVVVVPPPGTTGTARPLSGVIASPTADTLRTQHAQLLDDLALIGTNGRDEATKRRARTLRTQLN